MKKMSKTLLFGVIFMVLFVAGYLTMDLALHFSKYVILGLMTAFIGLLYMVFSLIGG